MKALAWGTPLATLTSDRQTNQYFDIKDKQAEAENRDQNVAGFHQHRNQRAFPVKEG